MKDIEPESAVSLYAVRGAHPVTPGKAYAFSGFTLDPGIGRLLRDGEEIPLRPKSFEVLEYLAANAERLVSREELLTSVWSNKIVTDDSLTHCIADIRKALGESGVAVVRTVPRRGYVFSPAAGTPQPGSDTPGDAPATATGSGTAGIFRRRAAGVALLILFAVAWWAVRDGNEPEEPLVAPAPPNSIAVLRFADMSENQDQAYLAEGLPDEILHLLAQSRDLIVMARTSSFALEGEDIATVADKLKVAYVLEGSVRRSGERVRVTAQLVDAATSAHVWSEVYESELQEITTVETQVAAAVANKLQVTLADGSAPAFVSQRGARAHELFFRGHFFYNRRAPGDIERARELYEEVIAIDPGFARAWVGLAAIYNLQQWHHLNQEVDFVPSGDARDPDIDERHRYAVEQALQLAPMLPEAHARAAAYYTLHGDLAKRVEHLEQARALDPDHPLVLSLLASQHSWSDRLDAATALLQQAVLRDPLGAVTRSNLAQKLLWAGRLEEALAEFRKVLALGRALSRGDGQVDSAVLGVAKVLLLQEPDQALDWIESWPAGEDRDYASAMLYHAFGRPVEAGVALERLIASAGASEPLRIAEVYAYRHDNDNALAWLGRVQGPESCRSWRFLLAFYSPILAQIRGDARWDAWRNDAARAMQAACTYRFSLPT